MSYFKQFPKVQYDFERNGVIQNIVNIYRSVRPLQNFIDNSTAYTFYEINHIWFWVTLLIMAHFWNGIKLYDHGTLL